MDGRAAARHAGNFESEGDVTVLLEGGKSAVPLDLYGMWVTDGDYPEFPMLC